MFLLVSGASALESYAQCSAYGQAISDPLAVAQVEDAA